MKTVEEQYQEYLKKVSLSEKDMSEIQRIEMRRTFFGAWGQCLIMLRDDLTKIEDDNEGVNELQKMLKEISNFFFKENNQQN